MKLHIILVVCLLGMSFPTFAQTFDNTLPVGGFVNAVAHDANYTYVGGNFETIGGNVTQGEAFDLATQQMLNLPAVNGKVHACVGDGNGGWFIGGNFTQVGGFTRNSLAHILPDKTLDMNWNPNVNLNVQDYPTSYPHIDKIVINGTDMFVTGYFVQIGGLPRNGFAKISVATGQVDANWNTNLNGINGIKKMIFVGNDIFVCGGFSQIGGLERRGIAKLSKITGQVDSIWNPNPNNASNSYGSIGDMLLYGTSLIISHNIELFNTQNIYNVAKISTTSTGAVDTAWKPNPNQSIGSMVLSGTNLFLSGQFTTIGGQNIKNLAKVDANTGQVDATWNPNPNNAVSVRLAEGDNLYVLGYFTELNGQSANNFAKISTTGIGSISAGWTNNFANLKVLDCAVYNNELYVMTIQNDWGGNHTIHKANTNSGALDTNWKIRIPTKICAGYLTRSTFFQNNNVYVSGDFAVIGGTKRTNLARFLKSNNSLDITWNPEVNGTVIALSIANGSLYVGGKFVSVGSVSRNSIAKVSTIGAGEIDATWNPNITRNNSAGYVSALASDTQNLYVGGIFDKIGNTAQNHIAKLNLGTGGLDTSWNPNLSPNDSVGNLILSNSDLFVLGKFSNIGGAQRNRIAKLNADGQANSLWNPNTNNGYVTSMTLSNNSLYVGGEFQNIGGQNIQNMAKLDLFTGNADVSWQLSIGLNNIRSVWSSNQSLYIAQSYENKIFRVSLATGNINLEMKENAPAFCWYAMGVIDGNDMYIFGNFTGTHGRKRVSFAKIIGENLNGIMLSEESLTGFITTSFLPSTSQNFVVNAINLPSNVGLSLSQSDWEISTDDTNWVNSLSLTPASGAINQTVYIRLKSGLTVGNKIAQIIVTNGGTTNQTVALTGTVTAQGGIAPSTNELSGFFTNTSQPSANQSFTINGTGLTSNVGLSLSQSDWELSTDNTAWASSLSILPTNGAIANQTIYIRLKGNMQAGNKSGLVTLTTTGFANKTVTLSGGVNAFPILSTGNLAGFVTNTNFPSSSKNFVVSGVGFIRDVQVSINSNEWEMSTNNQNWANTLTFAPASWTSNSKTMYVRLKSGLNVGIKTAILTVSTEGSNPQNVSLTGLVNTLPAIVISTNALGNFQSYGFSSSSSEAQSFTVNGGVFTSNLQAVVSTNDWEISANNQTWENSLSIVPTNGLITNKILYVRMKAGLPKGIKKALLSISVTGSETQQIALEGEITEPNALNSSYQIALEVYPNPSSTGIFQIRLGEFSTDLKIKILNLQGRQVHLITLNAPQENLRLDLSALPKGIYLLCAETKQGKITKRIVIQ